MPAELTDDARRTIFAALVSAQDEGMPVPASRSFVAERYAIALEQVVTIEREGLRNRWPPL